MAPVLLESFSALGPTIFLYTPPQHKKGQLIILCTWMGAADKHIIKYVNLHKTNFPEAKILLIKSTVPDMIKSYAAQRRLLDPAAQAILKILSECGYIGVDAMQQSPKAMPQILIHLFSTGGANTITQLLLVLNNYLQAPAPITGLVCDSAPAGASYQKAYSAFTNSLPKGFPANVLVPVACHAILILLYMNIAIGRYEVPEELFRKTILDEKLHGDPRDGSHRIAYIASEADKLTQVQDVLSHSQLAKKQGWKVKELVYDGTAHCNHMAEDGQVYLDIVKSVWERTL